MCNKECCPKAYHLYSALVSLAAPWLQSLILLVFRLYWGYQFYLTGTGKLGNHARVTEFFTSLGIPFPGMNAWFIGGLETVGGLALLLGIGSRFFGLMLTGSMVVAYISVAEDREKVFSIFQDPEPFLTADPFFFMLTSLLVLAFGAGYFSLDTVLSRVIKSKL